MCTLTGEPCGCKHQAGQVMGLQVSPTTVSPFHALKCMPSCTGVKMNETILHASNWHASLLLLYCMTNCNTVQKYSSESILISKFISNIQIFFVWQSTVTIHDS